MVIFSGTAGPVEVVSHPCRASALSSSSAAADSSFSCHSTKAHTVTKQSAAAVRDRPFRIAIAPVPVKFVPHKWDLGAALTIVSDALPAAPAGVAWIRK